MRTAKMILFLPLLFLALMATEAPGYYFGGLDDYAAGVPSQEDKLPFMSSGREVLYSGTVADIEPDSRSILIRSRVSGFFGPELVGIPVQMNNTGTVNICYRDTGECEIAGTEGWDTISSIPRETLLNADIVVVGYAEDQSRLITITTDSKPA
ncbi:MAG: hypothetical protein A2052_01350 [Deltaproteobacteria bacterium GWA2_54_12]|nr:MAG: hypothetical protein A2052_01350 [Deltaproteobacteria bacterium GWA2_54_12]